MKKKKIFFITGGLVIILAAVFFFYQNFLRLYIDLKKVAPDFKKESVVKTIDDTIKGNIFLPSPLKVEKEEVENNPLTKEEIIKWTNYYREKNGLPALRENKKLDNSALLKLQDMFLKHYFSHYSPEGKDVSYMIERAGYKFLTIGENLAMGNFKDDKDLVDAWMASPGHRANILNPNYREIGVAVLKGTFEGKETWISVQHFGLPLSVCAKPDLTLKEKIEENEKRLNEMESELMALKSEIPQTINPYMIFNRDEYLMKIENYNNLVSQYNSLLEETKSLIEKYNLEVNVYNSCVSGFVGK